jgi:SAM-dependent methyltransferase
MKRATPDDCLRQTRDYYDRTTELYVRHFGTTLQAGIVPRGHRACGPVSFREHNLFLAERAGIRAADRVLDAGCGVCGPSVDIASNLDELSIHCVTISSIQAQLARRYINAADLRSRLHVFVSDFHRMPYHPAMFDVVIFLESAGYSHDQNALFEEAHRVLIPGGRLYVKDVFSHGRPLTPEEALEIEQFDEVFAYRTRTLDATTEAIRTAGFHKVRAADLTGQVSTMSFYEAMFDSRTPKPRLNDFGKLHYRPFRCLPIMFAEIRAIK